MELDTIGRILRGAPGAATARATNRPLDGTSCNRVDRAARCGQDTIA